MCPKVKNDGKSLFSVSFLCELNSVNKTKQNKQVKKAIEMTFGLPSTYQKTSEFSDFSLYLDQVWKKDWEHSFLTNTWQIPYALVFKKLTEQSENLLIFMVILFSVPLGYGV